MRSADISEQRPIIDLPSLLVDTLRRSHGKHSYHWARILQILFSTILEGIDVIVVDAEEFLEIIQLESSNC